MLQLSKTLINVPVMSLRTGGRIGTATAPIIDPTNLKIEGWYVTDRFSKKNLVVLAKEIRDIIPRGIVVNDHDALTDPAELLRLQDVLKFNFKLLDKLVMTERQRHLGKVGDYATDVESLFIKKLYVEQSMLRSLTGGQLSIDRTQIVEISNRRIVVSEPDEKVTSPATVPASAT